MLKMLFSAKGRINRAPFWGYSILVSVIYMIIVGWLTVLSISSDNWIFAIIGNLFIIPIIWISFNLYIKRLHDLDKNGWMSLLLFVPLANFYLFIICGFFKWTTGKNKYGEDPLGGTNNNIEEKTVEL